MASKSTNIHVQGFTFPGEMKKFHWEFPVVSVPMKNGKKNIHTTFYVGLLNTEVDRNLVATRMNPVIGQKNNPNYIANFSFSDFALPLDVSMLDHSPLGSKIAFYVTKTQQDGCNPLFRDITFVKTGKSLGKKNRTNVFTQALADVLSKYNAKMNTSCNKVNNVITPMLAQGEGISGRDAIEAEVNEIMKNHLVTGIYVQPKYDGVRVLSTLNPVNNLMPNDVSLPYETRDNVVCYSRNGKRIMITDNLEDQLKELLPEIMKRLNLTTLVLDGEFYCHGMPLQEISGYARGTHDSETGRKSLINLVIYDFCDRSNKSYSVRHDLLASCSDMFQSNIDLGELLEEDTGNVTLSETHLFHKTEDVMSFYDKMIADGYEGIMIRLPEGIYESARSKSLIKVKPTISYEYECVGYEFGKGKDADIPTIKCKIGEQGVYNANEWWLHKSGKTSVDIQHKDHTFSAKFKGLTEVQQRALGEEFVEIEANGKTKFENRYLGRSVEIEFLNFSVDGKPEKPNCKGFTFDK